MIPALVVVTIAAVGVLAELVRLCLVSNRQARRSFSGRHR